MQDKITMVDLYSSVVTEFERLFDMLPKDQVACDSVRTLDDFFKILKMQMISH